MTLTWQQIQALSTLGLNQNLTSVKLMEARTKKFGGKRGLFVAIWLRGKPGAQRVYHLPKRSSVPKRWRDPLILTGWKK